MMHILSFLSNQQTNAGTARGQRWNEEVVHMAPGFVSLTKNKVKSNSYQCMKLWKDGKFCRQKGHIG